jgi:integrase
MSVKVRPYRGKTGGWHVDVNVRLSNGQRYRDRKRLSTTSKTIAYRWGQDRERRLLQQGLPEAKKEVPTLKQFAQRFLDEHARANRQKPSGIASKETILRVHLIPALGDRKLDTITDEQVQRLKLQLHDKASKTVNNVLTVLNVALKNAVAWKVIDKLPCSIRLLHVERSEAPFHEFDSYERLLDAARGIDWRTYLIVLLGGEGGLRVGEIVALQWTDIDYERARMWVRHSDHRGQLTTPKNGKTRFVGMTQRVAAALRKHRHLGNGRVLCKDDGQPLTHTTRSVVTGPVCGPACEGADRRAYSASYVLLASGDARRRCAGRSGPRRASGPDDDATLHAPESRRSGRDDSVVGA